MLTIKLTYIINNNLLLMQQFTNKNIPRPKTMLQNRSNNNIRKYADQYMDNPEYMKIVQSSLFDNLNKNQQTLHQYHQVDQQFYNQDIQQGLRYHNSQNNYKLKRGQSAHIVYLHIPKSSLGQENQKVVRNTIKINKDRPYSRQNMQTINKRYQQIRCSQYSSSTGIYDQQNDRRMVRSNTLKPEGNIKIDMLISPALNRKTVMSNNSAKTMKVNRQKKSAKNTSKIQGNTQYTFGKSDIFLPDKQSESGMVLHQFQSSLKKKGVEDNLYIMASVLKRKLKVLEKRDVVKYINKLMARQNQKE